MYNIFVLDTRAFCTLLPEYCVTRKLKNNLTQDGGMLSSAC